MKWSLEGWGTPFNDLHGKGRPERGTIFGFRFRVKKSFILFCRPKRATEGLHVQQLKGIQSSKLGMGKGYHLSVKGIQKGDLFCQKWYIKG